ncbi:hypothetical protein BZA05DRAFT_77452 [Tricharina praecox]|uniref:uncharacterized protein n=1 Tax=Tricharina praecox TaxID=43433 RepID=UPI002220659F|nr:uncharacterized protein BZA05DRAFT_77452 [Tricharina praecox]KAI5849798.1 hypothetical protein BZA05DRAFT_77452 [Tricharina praecox]
MSPPEEETRCSDGHLSPSETDPSAATCSSITGITIPKSASAPTAPPLLSSVSSVSVSRPPFPGNFAPSDREGYDRVFPIRSVVNIEPQPFGPESPGARSSASVSGSSVGPLSTMSLMNSLVGTPAREDSESFFKLDSHSRSTTNTTPYLSSAAPSTAARSASVSYFTAEAPGSQNGGSADSGAGTGFYTERHKHVITEDGHMIVTGVAGVEKMQRCEDEAIHIPGAVQGFGCLVAMRELEDGAILDVRVVSENSKSIIGYSPSELFARGNFLSVLSDEQADHLAEHIEFVRDDSDARLDGPEVFSLNVTGPDAIQIKLWCAIHLPAGDKSLFICEFELEDDSLFPLSLASDSSEPSETLDSKPTHEELLESTMSSSRPLRVLRSARKRRGDAAAMEVFSLMSQIQDQLASAADLTTFLKIVVGLVKELTGFHRVMIYQFDEAWNGRVVTELVDPRATKDLYKGLHFPASDIPAQARALYTINKVRLLYDREQTTARLVCNTREDLETPLDLTHSYLRAMSPIHLKYLGHMGVRASMSISITAFNQLWGLVSCHSYSPMRVSFPIRKMCRLVGETASRTIERLSYARRLHARKLINTVPTEQNPGGYIVASSDDLLKLFDADCGLLSIRDETKVLGKSENSQEALAMLEYLRVRNFNTVITSQDMVKDFPDLKYKPGFKVIAGLLLVPLSSEGRDFIVFFRQPQISHVHWAGNPYDKKLKEGTDAYLEPRTSFKIWSETVVGRSREWTEEQVETAAVLCLVYGKFIEVWRQKEAALKNSQLTRLLLANASHEVRTPLNAIINYLEIALEGPLDTETRDNLARSHSASKSLIYVINDLLDLTRTEEGQDLMKDEIFDLRQVVFEATDKFRADTDRKKLTFEVVEYPGLPSYVKGDPARLRQVISNVTANAVKHTSAGGLRIEIWAGGIQGGKCDIEIAVEDTGEGISPAKLNILFGEFEQIHTEEEGDILSLSHEESASFNALSKMPGQRVLGLGLAVVARAIRNMNGQLRLKSEEGKGSRFTLCVPFTIPKEESPDNVAIQQPARTPPPTQGEVTLIQPPAKWNAPEWGESSMSASSIEIDRLVDAISSPSIVGSPSSTNEYFTANSSLVADGPQSPPSRPLVPSRPASAGAAKSSYKAPVFDRLMDGKFSPGKEILSGSLAPVRPVRIPCEGDTVPSGAVVPLPPPARQPAQVRAEDAVKFTILVAEDDPINSKIIKKRLERMGHSVAMTANGDECFHSFSKACADYDAILMDMQMPIMNGSESTTRIRGLESNSKHPVPRRHATHGRIPIFAVSASLFEERWIEYADIGFDGWILKPIDFGRLGKLLEGTRDTALRREAEYVPGQWERGGWFLGAAVPPAAAEAKKE